MWHQVFYPLQTETQLSVNIILQTVLLIILLAFETLLPSDLTSPLLLSESNTNKLLWSHFDPTITCSFHFNPFAASGYPSFILQTSNAFKGAFSKFLWCSQYKPYYIILFFAHGFVYQCFCAVKYQSPSRTICDFHPRLFRNLVVSLTTSGGPVTFVIAQDHWVPVSLYKAWSRHSCGDISTQFNE